MYPILILNWLVGLGLADYPVGNSRNKLFLIVVILIATSFWMTNIYYDNMCMAVTRHGLAIQLYTMMRYFNTLVATSSIIIGWMYRKVHDMPMYILFRK